MFKLDRRRYRVGEPEPAYCREADLDKPDVCGIDVSAKELVVRVERCGRREGARNFSNTASRHQQLRDYLAAPGRPVRVCLEATGLYGLDVALWLERDARLQVMVANPPARPHPVDHFCCVGTKPARSSSPPADWPPSPGNAHRAPATAPHPSRTAPWPRHTRTDRPGAAR